MREPSPGARHGSRGPEPFRDHQGHPASRPDTGERSDAYRFSWLAGMVVWPLVEPLLGALAGDGREARRNSDEVVFAAVVFVLSSGSPWRAVPKCFEVSWQTAHRRFGHWSDRGLWTRVGALADIPTLGGEERYWAARIAAMAEVRSRRSKGGVHRADTDRPAVEPGLSPAISTDVPMGLVRRLFGRTRTG